MGAAKVYLDGALVATVNLHASATTWDVLAWSRVFDAVGSHTLKVTCQGTAGHPSVDVDAFVVLK